MDGEGVEEVGGWERSGSVGGGGGCWVGGWVGEERNEQKVI